MTTAHDLLEISPVVPVVAIDDEAHAVPLAQALLRGGIGIIEVTLRTPAALAAIERIAAEVPEIVLGAGTVTAPEHAAKATKAGASFLVTPGTTEAVLAAARDTGLALLPGAGFLKALGGPLPGLRFCPTGGITPESAPKYLALANVGCVGGSWLTPKDALLAGNWGAVEALSRAAAALRG